MLRLLFFAGLGILLAAVVVMVVGPPGAAWWALPLGLALMIGAGTLVAIARTTRGAIGPTARQVEEAAASGREGVARIDVLRQIGTQINEQPLCELDVSVQPHQGAAFRTTIRRVVPLTEIPLYQPGAGFSAVLSAGDPPVVGLVAPQVLPLRMPAADTLAWRAPEPGAGFGRPPLIGVGRRGRPLRIVAYVLVAAIAAAAVALPYRDALSQTIEALPQGRWHADVRQPQPLSAALEALREAIGHDVVDTVVVAADYVAVTAPLRPGETASDRWTYRRGSVSHDGPAGTQPELAAEQFSLDDVAWDRLWSLVQQAAAAERIADPAATTITVDRSVDDDIDSDTFARPVGPVEVVFGIGDAYRSAFYRAAADGTGLARTS
ncbi:hypothetical protein [Microbacterium sp. SORGH_AS_0888]|uniref:hypothetical protein n=1 Tax=Microbacterium sp. SORGH_AS_0888 TaxID=3041791 RepID=UPI00278B9D72|nr:hypothetical protein [Microbacterium sp. SORGH_AS_0888]MDQ1130150.1 hypothetical protein [Microbacterium sp. SORGH_AS_0888]